MRKEEERSGEAPLPACLPPSLESRDQLAASYGRLRPSHCSGLHHLSGTRRSAPCPSCLPSPARRCPGGRAGRWEGGSAGGRLPAPHASPSPLNWLQPAAAAPAGGATAASSSPRPLPFRPPGRPPRSAPGRAAGPAPAGPDSSPHLAPSGSGSSAAAGAAAFPGRSLQRRRLRRLFPPRGAPSALRPAAPERSRPPRPRPPALRCLPGALGSVMAAAEPPRLPLG